MQQSFLGIKGKAYNIILSWGTFTLSLRENEISDISRKDPARDELLCLHRIGFRNVIYFSRKMEIP